MQTALLSGPYDSGFAGPAGGQVDFTASPIDENGFREGPELMKRLEEYIALQGGSALPAASKEAALNVVRKFIEFHKGNENWGVYESRCFLKNTLTERMCDFFSYTIEFGKRLDANKAYMTYVAAKQLFLDIFFVGTVLAGLNQEESASLFLELNAMLDYKRNQRHLKLGDGPVHIEFTPYATDILGEYPPDLSSLRMRTKVPRVTKKLIEKMRAEGLL
ncbi:hypothetical protein QFC21_000872 [Naganishia friedmannii]|uniref:Uncharacterized protein n=1 Tax=Naganishia friedmannii TaxID=89922 RepID=A0ACC2W7M3_9TREE|nr:hypothetical protein QFC21_000872 [Naganishia friedmannii]